MEVIDAVTNAFTAVGLVVAVVNTALLLWPGPARVSTALPTSLTVIVPAHNEAMGIEDCLRAILASTFAGSMQVIVIDDGSDDDTGRLAGSLGVTVRRTAHLGKASALNAALREATGELVAVVDADSVVATDALAEAVAPFADPSLAAVCTTIRVRNRRTPLGMWLHVEQLYNSVLREAFAKINAAIVTPGPLSLYRRAALTEVGGFSTVGYSEDVDIALRLLAAGHRVAAAPRAVSDTTMPVTPRGFWRQRLRFTRGWIHIFRQHLRPGRTPAALVALPLALYGFVQAVVMSVLTLWTLAQGYAQQAALQGSYVVPAPLFVLQWLSLYGLLSWGHALAANPSLLTPWIAAKLVVSLMPYPLYLYAIARFDRRVDAWHLAPLFFMFPFWLAVMLVHLAALPALVAAPPRNRWTK